MSMEQVNLMHAMLVGPLLFYIGHKKNNTPQAVYVALGLLVALIPFIVRIDVSRLTYRSIINAMHYLLWIPLFGYVVYSGVYGKLNDYWWPILKLLGVAVVSVHVYLYLQKQGWVQ